jgi:hypothetical protein
LLESLRLHLEVGKLKNAVLSLDGVAKLAAAMA